MDDENAMRLDAARQKLLAAKLGSLLTWSIPEIVKTVGPYDVSAFVPFDERRRQIVGAVEEQLRSYDDAEIQVLLTDRRSDDAELVGSWRSFLAGEIERLTTRTPPWFTGGFGHPDYQADFDYWARMRHLEIDEVLCLSIGFEPALLKTDDLDGLRRRPLAQLPPPLQFLSRRRELLRRQFDPQQLAWRVRPAEFLEWVERTEFEIHPEFLHRLRRYHGTKASVDPQSTDEAHRPDKREIATMARLLLGIAMDAYGYVPGSRSPVPKEIADVIATHGLSVTPETVRKYLQLGATQLPKDE